MTQPLLYNWEQGDSHVDVSFRLPPGITKANLSVKIEAGYVVAGVKGLVPTVMGKLWSAIDNYESLWQIEASCLTIHLEKIEPSQWPVAISGPLESPKNLPAGTVTVPDAPLIDAHSSFILGVYQHMMGLSDPAMKLFKSAAAQGHLEAQLQASAILSTKLPFTEEDEKDTRSLLQMAIDQHSSPAAMVMKAELGSTTEEERMQILSDAADKYGFAPARTRLGELQLQKADKIADESNPERMLFVASGIANLEQASGERDFRAAIKLGFILMKGEYGKPKNIKAAKVFFDQAKAINSAVKDDPSVPTTKQLNELIEQQEQQLILKQKAKKQRREARKQAKLAEAANASALKWLLGGAVAACVAGGAVWFVNRQANK